MRECQLRQSVCFHSQPPPPPPPPESCARMIHLIHLVGSHWCCHCFKCVIAASVNAENHVNSMKSYSMNACDGIQMVKQCISPRYSWYVYPIQHLNATVKHSHPQACRAHTCGFRHRPSTAGLPNSCLLNFQRLLQVQLPCHVNLVKALTMNSSTPD